MYLAFVSLAKQPPSLEFINHYVASADRRSSQQAGPVRLPCPTGSQPFRVQPSGCLRRPAQFATSSVLYAIGINEFPAPPRRWRYLLPVQTKGDRRVRRTQMHVEKTVLHPSARRASYQLAPQQEDQSWRGERPPGSSRAECQVERDLSVVPPLAP